MFIQFLCLVAVPNKVFASPTGHKRRTGGTAYAGVNIAGFDFGCLTDGNCTVNEAVPPLSDLSNGMIDGVEQMQHFFQDRGLNLFRLPAAWQYLTKDDSFTTLDSVRFSNYDKLVQGCLSTGAKCIIDLHNYAHYDGAIIGQSDHLGPTNVDFANFWTQMATKYKSQSQIVYGIMNEPHDLDMDKWAATVQEAVNAIRTTTGNNDNLILLPGTAYTAAGAFASQSYVALAKVTNLDGSFDNLVFDVHQYLDPDRTGKQSDCNTDGTEGLKALQSVLVGRQALLSETGGGPSDESCIANMCMQIEFLNQFPDQFLGYTAWSAGSFPQSYELTLVPTKSGDVWTDVPLMMKCLARR